MIYLDGSIAIDWHETLPSAALRTGSYPEVVEQTTALMEGGRLEHETRTVQLYRHLAAVSGIDAAEVINSSKVDLALPEEYRYNGLAFLFDEAVKATEVHLVTSAITHSKTQPLGKARLTTAEWSELAFERRLDAIEDATGRSVSDYIEYISDAVDPDSQKKFIGHVAAAIINADALKSPQLIIWHDELVTIQTQTTEVR